MEKSIPSASKLSEAVVSIINEIISDNEKEGNESNA